MKHNWTTLASTEKLQTTVKNLQSRGFDVLVVKSGAEAVQTIAKLIPQGAEVMTGSSTTLKEIGFNEALEKGHHGWKNVQADVWSEDDEAKRTIKRRLSVTSEYFLASPNAVSQDGELVFCDASGSRIGALPFAAQKVVLVAGTQKITSSLETAMQRIRDHVFPLEDERSQDAYGVHSSLNKWFIFEREIQPHRVTLILVQEKLGF